MSKSIVLTVTSASALDAAQKKEVVSLVEAKLGKNVDYQYVVDAKVLGGIKLTLGNQEFDATLQGTLKKLEPQVETVSITTAVSISDKQRRFLLDGLTQKLGFEPNVKEIVDPTIIGGVILRIGSALYDHSLAKKLRTLESMMGEQL